MIVGAQKAGTTSLKNYLIEHPGVCGNERSEITYFISDEEYALGYDEIHARYYKDPRKDHAVLLGKSVGIMYLPEAARRLREHNPNVHIVVVLRNPVDRSYSGYWYARGKGWEDIERFEDAFWADSSRFKELVKQRNCAYLHRSLYDLHLKMLFETFGRDRVHVFLFEDLRSDPVGLCQQIYHSIGVDSQFTPQAKRRYNKASRPASMSLAHLIGSDSPIRRILKSVLPEKTRHAIKGRLRKVLEREFVPPVMATETRRQLVDYFKEHNARLAEMIGRDLQSWDRV